MSKTYILDITYITSVDDLDKIVAGNYKNWKLVTCGSLGNELADKGVRRFAVFDSIGEGDHEFNRFDHL
jgi:hypothetical protein